jgi:hypothetical protein
MAGWAEAASGSLTLLAFWSAFSRFRLLGASDAVGGSIVTSPAPPLTVPANAPVGTVVATLSVVGGSGSYTFSLASDPLGYFTIVGNQLQVNAAMVAGTDNIVVQATGSSGDVIQLPLSVIITPVGYIPTYPYYGF